MNLGRCNRLDFGPLTGPWYRALRLRYWPSRLATDQSRAAKSRFSWVPVTMPAPRLLYLGETHQGVIYEVGALLGPPTAPISNPAGSWMILRLDVRLLRVVDLCSPSQQKILRTTDQEMTGIWANADSPTPTQRLGAALFAIPDLEAMIVPSSKPGGGRNLVIFPDKLGSDSSLVFDNELSGKIERLI